MFPRLSEMHKALQADDVESVRALIQQASQNLLRQNKEVESQVRDHQGAVTLGYATPHQKLTQISRFADM